MASNKQFEVIRQGKQSATNEAQRPPSEMLDGIPDGTVVRGPDGVQWIAMPAVPRRWERSKKPITTGQNS